MRAASAISAARPPAAGLPVPDYRAALDALAEATVIFDAEGRVCYVNDAACRLLERSAEQLHGDALEHLRLVDVSGRLVQPRERVVARVLTSGIAVRDHIVGITADDGTQRWFNVNVAPLFEDGAMSGAIASFADATAARRVSHALKSSETINRQLMDALADGVFVAQDFQFVFGNPALAAMLGLTHDEVVGLSFRRVVPKEFYGVWIERYAQRIGTGPEPLRRYEMRLLHADGETRVDVEIVATRTRYGDRPAVLGVVRDIRERIRLADELQRYRSGLEELVVSRTTESNDTMTALLRSEHSLRVSNGALAEAEKFTRDIADNLPVRVAYWDRKMQCRFVNRAYCDWYGFTPEQLLGRTHDEVFADHEVADRVRNLSKALQGHTLEHEREHTAIDGTPARSVIHLIPDRHGNDVRGVLVLGIDVTTQWRAQAALELVNEQLVAARDRAESAGRAKSAFLANMSHEIRTPMNAIIGLTHLLQRDTIDVGHGERLGRIADAAQHLLQIINDILDLSKIEAGKVVVESTTFDLEQTLRSACALVEAKASVKGLRLVTSTAGLPRHVAGDPTRISQALVNLIDNAIKFTAKGSVEVRATVADQDDASWLLRFEVRDTGIGIEPEHLDRLFSAFEQADSSTNRRFGGSGLGLSLTRHLARLMGGDAGGHSVPGQGSTFWVTVRVRTAEGALAVAPMADAETFLRTHHRGTRVLLAEDNEVNQEVSVSLLESVGLDVDVAEDGGQAVAMMARNDYALVLMDMQMPGMDGLEASRRIRATTRGASLPIVAMTANAFAEDRDAVLAAGMDDHLGKPVNPSLLFATVARWLGATRADVQAPVPALAHVRGIDGLDVDRGLAFFGGRPEPYLLALATFVRLYGGPWAGLLGNFEAARRELHSTGSACASVGATGLGDLAHELLGHRSAHAGGDEKPPIARPALQGFADRLRRLSDDIAARLQR